MKPGPTLAALLVLATISVAVHAETKPPPVLYTATVKDATAEVRSGPSTDPKMYATNTLKQGQTVQVVKEWDGGWLAIKPPPGSFSWINTRFLERVGQSIYWVVITHDDAPIPVRIGSELTDSKPTVEGARLARGTSVVAIGRELVDPEEGVWLPIEPPEMEVRYIRAQSVVKTPPTTTTAAASPATPAPPITPADSGFSTPAPLPPPPVAPGALTPGQSTPPPPAAAPGATGAASGTPEEMWQKAEEMEKAGRPAEAERLYAELGEKVKNSNHDIWMRCLNRLHFLRSAARTATTAAYTMTRPTEARYGSPTAENRIQPVPANGASTVTNYTSPCPAPGQMQQAYSGYTATQSVAQPTTQAGRLRAAGRSLPGDSRRLYMLEMNNGQPIAYVVPQPGVDLESYLSRNVELSGMWVYNGELRANCLTATRVTLLP
jgi:hypothetical protein